MRPRTSRPLTDLSADAARPRPVRVLIALVVTAALGTGGYLVGATALGGSADRDARPASPAASAGDQRPDLPVDTPFASDDRTPPISRSESGAATAAPSAARSAVGDVTPTPSPSQVTDSPSTSATTPSPSTSEPSETVSASAQDVTPPRTSLSEEFPEVDAALFSFSANEPATFTCSLDGAAYASCEATTLYSDLDPGWHTLAVRAEDAAGNVDPTPAESRWHARDNHAAGG